MKNPIHKSFIITVGIPVCIHHCSVKREQKKGQVMTVLKSSSNYYTNQHTGPYYVRKYITILPQKIT